MQGDTGIGEFLKSINLRAQQHLERLEEETNDYISAEMAAAEASIRRKTDDAYERRRSLILNDSARELSARQREAKSELFKFRKELTDRIIDDAREKISAFSNTKEYQLALCKSADAVVKAVGDDAVLYVRHQDIGALNEFAAKHPSVRICADESNMLGGLRAVNAAGTLAADSTYESKLQQARADFCASGRLIIE
ncbi:MAG: V-type ATP synthase subunit E family protein [Firmicutes bacterium]|nr:V-type ATP synthase subunit E family protein [Bacillota bacterium]